MGAGTLQAKGFVVEKECRNHSPFPGVRPGPGCIPERKILSMTRITICDTGIEGQDIRVMQLVPRRVPVLRRRQLLTRSHFPTFIAAGSRTVPYGTDHRRCKGAGAGCRLPVFRCRMCACDRGAWLCEESAGWYGQDRGREFARLP